DAFPLVIPQSIAARHCTTPEITQLAKNLSILNWIDTYLMTRPKAAAKFSKLVRIYRGFWSGLPISFRPLNIKFYFEIGNLWNLQCIYGYLENKYPKYITRFNNEKNRFYYSTHVRYTLGTSVVSF
ncbi:MULTISPECIES: hypothetical protein, partial [unclassified Moorena]|uniref:hypothetical protein n=1 Tax=unclassified Moorena TaxID=2683338 RepID=UPI00258059D2